jgi:hypothetical protein
MVPHVIREQRPPALHVHRRASSRLCVVCAWFACLSCAARGDSATREATQTCATCKAAAHCAHKRTGHSLIRPSQGDSALWVGAGHDAAHRLILDGRGHEPQRTRAGRWPRACRVLGAARVLSACLGLAAAHVPAWWRLASCLQPSACRGLAAAHVPAWWRAACRGRLSADGVRAYVLVRRCVMIRGSTVMGRVAASAWRRGDGPLLHVRRGVECAQRRCYSEQESERR